MEASVIDPELSLLQANVTKLRLLDLCEELALVGA